MAKFKVSLEKENELLRRMAELGIREEDLIEKFLKGSGPGGQKINKTSSCVYLLHSPTGIEVKCQLDRSQAINRYLARRELCERIATKIFKIETDKKREIHKLKKQKKKRSKRAKEKMLRDKGLRSKRKRLRDKVRSNHD